MSPAPDVTVVIINYRTADTTSTLARRIRARFPGLPIVIRDNSDSERDLIELRSRLSDPTIRVERSPGNVGFGKAANAVLHTVATPYALLVNPDLVDVPDIPRLAATARRTGAAVVGAVVLDHSGLRAKGTYGGAANRATFLRYLLPVPGRSLPLMAPPVDGDAPLDVGWVCGACMLLDVELWRTCQFDERLFLYGEDIDLCWRNRESSHRVVLDPGVRVRHLAGGSSGGRPPLMWATNLGIVMDRRVRGARFALGAGLAWRGLVAVVLGRADHGRFLLRSAHAAVALR